MPKKRRKGYDFCFRIDMKNTAETEGRKFILAARSDDMEGEEKMKMWKAALAKIEKDAPAEKAAEKSKANKAKFRQVGQLASVLGGDKVRSLYCIVHSAFLSYLWIDLPGATRWYTGRPGSRRCKCRAREATPGPYHSGNHRSWNRQLRQGTTRRFLERMNASGFNHHSSCAVLNVCLPSAVRVAGGCSSAHRYVHRMASQGRQR